VQGVLQVLLVDGAMRIQPPLEGPRLPAVVKLVVVPSKSSTSTIAEEIWLMADSTSVGALVGLVMAVPPVLLAWK
jgi:hypothetical protein